MRTVPKEIVYEETACGLFAPKPTRAQKRAAKQTAELRAENREALALALGCVLLLIVIAAVETMPLTIVGWLH